MTPLDIRADIPALEDAVYLNTGASGPSPRGVVAAAETFVEHHEFEPGARRFEIGTTNPAPYVALQTAIETLDEIGLGQSNLEPSN